MKLELTDLAVSLDLPLTTVERWIRQGRIPIRKSGSRCVFKKAVLEKWAKKHDISFLPPKKIEEIQGEISDDSLVSAIKRGGVHHNISGESVEDVLRSAAASVPELTDENRDILVGKLIERESLSSTGIGKGVAIPHPRTPMPGESIPPMIATCFLNEAIEFGAIDGAPVSVLFVIICPTVKTHLNQLSRLSYCVRDDDFVSFIKTAPEDEAFYDAVSALENRLDQVR